MQRYFSHICDDTDVHADWRRSCTYGPAPNAIDISKGSLTCPSYTDTGHYSWQIFILSNVKMAEHFKQGRK